MVAGRFRLPDLDGILVEKVLDHMAEQLRPAKGQAWDSLEHRYADGFVELCRTYADVEPTGRFKFTIVTHRHEDGTADCDGFDLAPETLDAITPDAMVKARVDDTNGFPTDTTRAKPRSPRMWSGSSSNATPTAASRGAITPAGSRSTIWCPAVRAATTASTTSPGSARITTGCSSPTANGSSPATRTRSTD